MKRLILQTLCSTPSQSNFQVRADTEVLKHIEVIRKDSKKEENRHTHIHLHAHTYTHRHTHKHT